MSYNTNLQKLISNNILVTSPSTYIINNFSRENLVLSGTSIDQIVNLGNTLSYTIGQKLKLISNNTEVVNVVNNSGNTIVRLEPYNSIELILLDNLTANGTWLYNVTFAPPSRGYNFREEFNTGTATSGMTNWTNTASGAGAGSLTVSTLFGRKSIYQLSTGTTNAGRIAFGKSSNGTLFGNQIMFCYETDIYIPTLSTVGERYLLTVGYGDNIVVGDHLDGIYFEYDESLNPTWRLKTANNGTRSTTVTAVAVAINTWIKLRLEVNRNGSEVLFFINNQFVGNITTNIPTASGRTTDLIYKINKTAGNLPRTVLVDYCNENTYVNR